MRKIRISSPISSGRPPLHGSAHFDAWPHRAPFASVSLLSVESPNVVVETVKWAVDGNGLIVRFYECQRCRGQVRLKTGFNLGSTWPTNLLEENQGVLTPDGNTLSQFVRPHEIVTLCLVPA